MKTKLFLISSILICTIYFGFFSCKPEKKPLRLYDTTLIDKRDSLIMKMDTLQNLTILNKGKKYFLKEKLSDTFKMVFVFSISQNSSEINHLLHTVKKYQSKIGVSNIVLLGEFKNSYDQHKFREIHQIEVPFFQIPFNKSFDIPKSTIDKPYAVIMNNTLKLTVKPVLSIHFSILKISL